MTESSKELTEDEQYLYDRLQERALKDAHRRRGVGDSNDPTRHFDRPGNKMALEELRKTRPDKAQVIDNILK